MAPTLLVAGMFFAVVCATMHTSTAVGVGRPDAVIKGDNIGERLKKMGISSGASPDEMEKFLPGVLELDDFTFDKVVDGSRNVFVMFYAPWSDKCKDYYRHLQVTARATADDKSMLVAKVNGETNPKVFKLLEIGSYPALRFYPEGSTTGITYYGRPHAEDIVKFMKEIPKAGKVDSLEELVTFFMQHDAGREGIVSTTEKIVAELEGKEAGWGTYYLKVMNNVVAKGKSYVQKEAARLQQLLRKESLKKEKALEFQERMNVLKVFAAKDEL